MIEKPADLRKAVALLEQSERCTDFKKRAIDISAAIDLLDAHVEANPDSDQKEFIEKIKLTYTRKHLQDFSRVVEPDLETWFSNFVLFRCKAGHAVEQVLSEWPHLRPWYDSFIESRREEVRALFQREGLLSSGDS